MSDREDEKRYKISAQSLWRKARINAFAHRIASDRSARLAGLLSGSSIFFGILSIIFVLLAYMTSQGTSEADGKAVYLFLETYFSWVPPIGSEKTAACTATAGCTAIADPANEGIVTAYFTLIFTVFSVFFSTSGLLTTIFGSTGKYGAAALNHDFLQSLYLEIAQSCGPLKTDRDELDPNKYKSRLKELEYRFRIVKMRGSEPSDWEFLLAHWVFNNKDVDQDKLSSKRPFRFTRWIRMLYESATVRLR